MSVSNRGALFALAGAIAVGPVVGASPGPVRAELQLKLSPTVLRWTESVDAHQAAGVLVEDPRPVAKAMALLSRQLRWSITYEDPVYLNAADLRVLDRRHAIPRRGRLQLPDSAVMETAQRDPVAFLESVLEQEETAYGRVKRFKVLRAESMFHVVPDRVLDAAGRWRAPVPILDTWIHTSHGAITLSEFLETLCEDLSAVSAIKVVTATIPGGPLANTIVPAQDRTAQARTLLVEALSKMPVPLKWMLMYDPSSATYYLSVTPPGAF